MKPIKFKEQNCVYAENQKGYLNLPSFKAKDDKGTLISCWKGNFIERLWFLLTGRMWFMTLTFNKPLQPQLLTPYKSKLFETT